MEACRATCSVRRYREVDKDLETNASTCTTQVATQKRLPDVEVWGNRTNGLPSVVEELDGEVPFVHP